MQDLGLPQKTILCFKRKKEMVVGQLSDTTSMSKQYIFTFNHLPVSEPFLPTENLKQNLFASV